MPTIITRGAVSAYALGFARNMASGVVKDDYFEYVTMLLPGNGTNGAQNNTFLDSSSNAFSITRNGNTTQGTFSPYGSNWSNYFDGTGDYLSIADNAALDLSTGDFTIEFWVFPITGISDVDGIISKRNQSVFGTNDWRIAYRSSSTAIGIATGGNNTDRLTPAITLNAWNHIAFVRSSGTLSCYANGVRGDNLTWNENLDNSEPLLIGLNVSGYDFPGYISNVRIVKGSAVYSGSTYNVPTAPLTAITNTSLLTCQSNRFIDNSSNAFAITLNGTPSVQRFSPFSPSAAYSAAIIGGSGYFDGSGDYLSTGSSTAFDCGTGDFTVECWVYITSNPTGSYPNIISCTNWPGTGACSLRYGNTGYANKFTFHLSSASPNDPQLASSSTFPLNAWHHVAVTRSGNNFTLWVNGTSQATDTDTTSVNFNYNSAGVRIGGGNWDGANSYIPGYICDLRLVKGTAVYTAAFTPPTAPLTAITNTSLLCSMTNAGIIDNAMMNDLETVGNAQISTTQSKFGGSSMYFDGTGDYLTVNNATANLCAFGTGDFTVEAWIYIASNSAIQILIDARGSQVASDPWQFYTSSTGKLVFNYGSNLTGSTTISANTWTHVAACRASGTLRLFVNGTQDTSATVTGSVNAVAPVYVGRTFDTSGTLYFNGYIDDLRITKGYARYTANFTAPTAAFPTS